MFCNFLSYALLSCNLCELDLAKSATQLYQILICNADRIRESKCYWDYLFLGTCPIVENTGVLMCIGRNVIVSKDFNPICNCHELHN